MMRTNSDFLGSTRASRVGDRAIAIANFSCGKEDCFGVAPKPAREARALPRRDRL
jgi:hypothetical protein